MFEAFCGATEWIINQKIGNHVGYHVVQKFIDHLFDQLDISLEHAKVCTMLSLVLKKRKIITCQNKDVSNGIRNMDHEFGRIKYESKRVVSEPTGYSTTICHDSSS